MATLHFPEKMALRVEQAFGVDMETLMRMRCSSEIARARKRKTAFRWSATSQQGESSISTRKWDLEFTVASRFDCVYSRYDSIQMKAYGRPLLLS